jgi:hypothetical protein
MQFSVLPLLAIITCACNNFSLDVGSCKMIDVNSKLDVEVVIEM